MHESPKKYVIAFFITTAIFFTAFYISNSLNEKRLEEIRSIESKIAIDILSSETQFSLLSESSCKDLPGQNVLSFEINSLGQKLSFTEEQLGSDNEEVIGLKKYYSLLQIKDYLLMKKVSERCGVKPISIIYFYSNKGDCKLCQETAFVLTHLRKEYPDIRVYAFDYNLPLSAIKTLVSIQKVKEEFPAIVYNDEVFYNLKDIDDFEKVIPELKKMRLEREKVASSTNSTSTKK